jgi:hypothetical protein
MWLPSRVERTWTAPINGSVQATALLGAFFRALGSADTTGLHRVLHPDFYMYEHARWTEDSLRKLMPVLKGRRWKFCDVRVHVEGGMALVTYENHSAEGWWLESAILRRVDDSWRIGFLHSTRMGRGAPDCAQPP